MSTISVVLVPVSLMPMGATQLRVVAYKPGGEWLRSRLVRSHSALETARELVNTIAALQRDLPRGRPEPEAAGFLETETELQLVFTAPLPLTAPLMEQPVQDASRDENWPLLAPWLGTDPDSEKARKQLGALDDVHRLVLNHWRQLIEETTAAFELLPEHFTTSQVRAIYSSVWGTPQDAGNFHRWLHKLNRHACAEVAAEDVQRDVDLSLRQSLQGTALQTEGLNLRAITGKRLIGISPLVLGALGGLPTLAVASAVAAGYVAYQGSPAPGKPPQWYTTAGTDRRVLDVLYSPRPPWLLGGSKSPR